MIIYETHILTSVIIIVLQLGKKRKTGPLCMYPQALMKFYGLFQLKSWQNIINQEHCPKSADNDFPCSAHHPSEVWGSGVEN